MARRGVTDVVRGPILLAFDGSDNAAAAIARAAELFKAREAVVLSVWEQMPTWEPYDPATIIEAPLSRFAAQELKLDELVFDAARQEVERGVRLASQAGFAARPRVERGKAWRVICDIADEIDAAAVVVGARGLSRVGSVLLGSVSNAVMVHCSKPVLVVPHATSG